MKEKSTILLIEDQIVHIDVIKSALSENFALKVATNGELGLHLAALGGIDMILLDVMMPGLSGYDVCRKLKENQLTADIPIIFLTSKEDAEDELEGLSLGANDYMRKPVHPQLLRLRINLHLEMRSHQDHLELLIRDRTQELERAKQNLSAAQAIARLGSWEWDLLTGKWFWSDEMFQILGLEPTQVAPSIASYLTWVNRQDWERVHQSISQLPTRPQSDFQLEHGVQRAHETKRIIVMIGKAIYDGGQITRWVGTLRDVTNFRLIEKRNDQAFQSQVAINALLETALEKLPLKRQLEVALDIILTVPWLSVLGQGSIFLFDKKTELLHMTAERNLSAHLLKVCKIIPLGHCLCGLAAKSRATVFFDHLAESQHVTYEGITDHGHFCVPILHDKNLVGVLNLYLPAGHEYAADEDAFMSSLANSLAGLINQRRTEELLEERNNHLLEQVEQNELLNRLLESTVESVPLQDQLDQALTMLFYLSWLPVQPPGAIFLVAENSADVFLASYTHHFTKDFESYSTFAQGRCICGELTSAKMVIHTSRSHGMQHNHCCIPIFEGTKMTGMLLLYLDGVQSLHKKHEDFLYSVAKLLSVIVARKRLDSQLVASLREQETTNKKLEQANNVIRQAFGRYMSKEVMEIVLDSPEGFRLGGGLKLVTVMMSDLRGFTRLSEQHAPEIVLEMLNMYLAVMTEIIMRRHGTIIEFLGDGILALFGAPITRADDALQAVACALEMQQAMEKVNVNNRQRGFPEFEMGIGLNTGEVVAGNIGSEKRSKYGVVGRVINRTSRIESLTIGGQILISEETYQACGPEQLRIDDQWEVMPKGVPHPITIYQVGGVDGELNIHLPKLAAQALESLSEFVPIHLRVMEGKYTGQEQYPGHIIAIKLPQVDVEINIKMERLTNVNVRLLNAHGEVISDELFGKVVTGDQDEDVMRIHFTSISEVGETLLRMAPRYKNH